MDDRGDGYRDGHRDGYEGRRGSCGVDKSNEYGWGYWEGFFDGQAEKKYEKKDLTFKTE
jgi:hypothetical protein